MPCPLTGPKMFYAGPNLLSQPKNLTAFSKTFVPAQKPILLNANHLFVWHKMLVTATTCVNKYIFGPAQKIWSSPKHFGTCKALVFIKPLTVKSCNFFGNVVVNFFNCSWAFAYQWVRRTILFIAFGTSCKILNVDSCFSAQSFLANKSIKIIKVHWVL